MKRSPFAEGRVRQATAVVLIRLACLWCACGVAAATARLQLDGFTTKDGLVNNHVTALCQERTRGLWVGAIEGLCTFDGRSFESLDFYENAPYGPIVELAVDDRERVWVVSQEAVSVFEHGRFRKMTWDDPVPIKDAFMDSRNRLWLSTLSGVFRVGSDGHIRRVGDDDWRDRLVSVFFEDPAGAFWIGFRFGGLARLVDDTMQWRFYGLEDGLPNQTINDLAADRNGQLWAATLQGVFLLRDDRFMAAPFTAAMASRLVYHLLVDDQNRLWLNGPRLGLARWNGRVLRRFGKDDGLPGDMVTAMHRNEAGQLWFFTERGVSLFRNERFESADQADGLGASPARVFFSGPNGVIWLGSDSGLFRYESPQLETLLEDPTTQRLPPHSIARRIVRDRAGGLWFPSLDGLGYYDNRRFRRFGEEDGLTGRETHALMEDGSGRIWAAQNNGVCVGGPDGFRAVAHPELARRTVRKMLMDERERLWMLDSDNVVWLNADPAAAPERGFKPMTFSGVADLHAADDGSVWIECIDALYQYDRNLREHKYAQFLAERPSILNPRVFLPEGLWVQGFDDGVYTFDGATLRHYEEAAADGVLLRRGGRGKAGEVWFQRLRPSGGAWPRNTPIGLTRWRDGRIELFGPDEAPLADYPLEEVFIDERGNRWLFTRKGLTLLNLEAGETRSWTVADGLAGNLPTDLLWDANGALWTATNGGLNKIEGEALTKLTTADGLLDDFVHDIALDADQRLWIRTARGVQRYRENATPPPVAVAAAFDGDKPLDLDRLHQLSHRQNNLIFQLSSVYLARGAARIQYAYALYGEDARWSGVTREPRLHFPGLEPGPYLLEVKAYNHDLYASEEPVSFSFIIHPPLWRRTWAALLAIAAMLLFGYLLYRLRLRGKLEKARIFNELKTAQEMQMNLMPKAPPRVANFDVYGKCAPAREVGGDFFDHFWMDEARRSLGFAIMDVSGKSMEAAIISVMTSGLVYGEIGEDQTPAGILTRMNGPLYQKTNRKTFTTGLIAALDVVDRRLTWSNAGHADPLVIREGKLLPLAPPPRRDLPLGARAKWSYGERDLALRPGDLVLFYTDGLDEATNANRQLFGHRRLAAFLERQHDLPARELVDRLLAEVTAFVGKAPQHDDITLIAIKATVEDD